MSRKPDFSRPVIALDCDGVLADMVTPALEIVRGLGGPDLTHDALQVWDIDTLLPEGPIRDEFYNRIGAEGFNRSLKPYPGAEEAVERLRKVGEVVCVTTSLMSSKTWAYERYHWLKKHFGFPKSHVIQTAGKFWVRADILADDKPETVREVSSFMRGFLIDRSYNLGENNIQLRGTLEQFVTHCEKRHELGHLYRGTRSV